MKEKRKNLGVSEIIGTILLLGISVTLFSGIQLYVFSAEQSAEPIKPIIGGSLKDSTIILQHLGGRSLDEQTRIQYQIGNSTIKLFLNSSFFIDDNNNQKWDVGEIIRYPVSGEEDSIIEVKVIDEKSNDLLFINVLQQELEGEN